MASAELEKILRKLLVPDNHIIQQATIELKTAFTKTDVVLPALIELLQNCTEPTIRQYCSILLRRRIVKQWNSVNDETKNSLKCLLLTCVTRETVPFVLGSICQVAGSIARHDFANNAWPELLQFISHCIQSSVANEREVGFTLLYAVCESASEQLKPWYKELFPVFKIGLYDHESKNNSYLAIRCICPLIQYFGTDEEVLLKPMLGEIMNAIKTLLKEDEDKANEALDFFDELVQIEVGIIVPYVKLLVEFCMQIISCNDFEEGLRVKALYLICWACRRKSKIILKEKLLKPLITQLLFLMSMPEDEDDTSEDDMAEINSLQSVASQALDLLALHSPPAQLIPILMESLSSLFTSSNHFERKAAYIALGELAEGCADFIRTRHLKDAVETAMKGLSDQSVIVRNAALFALGQYAEHVQPDVSKLHENVIPMLLIFLQTLVNDPQPNVHHKGTITKLFYALEKFTEGLDKEVVFIYTDKLMESFLYLLKNSKDAHMSELAISAIGALATSAGEHLSNYFSVIMEHLKVYLQQPLTLENMDIIAQTVDTLGALARNIKSDIFYPVANDCVQFGVKVIEDCEDPDLKRCTYGLFSAVSFVLKDKMEFYLPSIIQAMMLSLSSTDGIVATDASNDPLFLIEDETGEEDIEDEEDENATGYTVENAYMDEKEDTINSLAELAENVGKPIMSYMEEVFKEIFLLVDYPHENVRKASVTACCRLTSVVYKHLKDNQASDLLTANLYIARSLPTVLNVINKDDDRSVVIAAVEVLNDLIKNLKGDLFIDQQYADDLANSIFNLLKGKTHCQQFLDDEEPNHVSVDEDDSLAELDHILVEQAGDLLPSFAEAIGGENFKKYFNIILPEIMKKSKKNSTVAEKSFAAGTIAEIIQAMGVSIGIYVQPLTPWLIQFLQDNDEEVRSNAAFGLGVLCEHGGDAAKIFYVNILQSLFNLLTQQKQPPLVQDNVCGAVSRMVMTSKESLPMQQVLSVLIDCLPIKEDERENETVMKCLSNLYVTDSSILLPYLQKLIPVFIESHSNENSGIELATREKLKIAIEDIQRKFPLEFNQIILTLKPS